MDAPKDVQPNNELKEKKKVKAKVKKSNRLIVIPLLSAGIEIALSGRIVTLPTTYDELVDSIIDTFSLDKAPPSSIDQSNLESVKQAIRQSLQLSLKWPALIYDVEQACTELETHDILISQLGELNSSNFDLLRDDDTVYFGYPTDSQSSHSQIPELIDPSIIELSVQDDSSEPAIFFRYKRNQKLEKLMKVYCIQKSFERSDVGFTIRKSDSTLMSDSMEELRDVHPTDTPETLGLIHRAVIYAKKFD